MGHFPCWRRRILYHFSLFPLFFAGFVAALDTRDFYPPMWGEGKQFVDAFQPFGEPLNVIISGRSHPDVLSDFGIQMYARSLGFSQECLSFYASNTPFVANLGDGHGWRQVLMILREDYTNDLIGSCMETFVGGNHFRTFRQNGPTANTSALFLSVALEDSLSTHHMIAPNGYNLGRDILVARAAKGTSYGEVRYTAKVEDVVGLMEDTEQVNHDIGVDGVVKVLTVDIVAGVDFFKGTQGYADGALGEQVTTTVWIAPTEGA